MSADSRDIRMSRQPAGPVLPRFPVTLVPDALLLAGMVILGLLSVTDWLGLPIVAAGISCCVALAFAVLPPRRALLQSAAALTITLVLAVVAALGWSATTDGSSPSGTWLATAATVVVVSVVMRRMSRSLRQRARVAEAVAQLGQQALTVTEPDELLEAALTVAVDVLKSDYGTALHLLPDGRFKVAAELGPESMPSGSILQLAPTRSYALHVVESGLPFVSTDLRKDPRVAPPGPLLDRGVVSGLAVPLIGADGPVGILAVHARKVRRFTADEVAALQAMANVVAIAWEQVKHRERLSHQALHDRLTGLPNRALLLDRLEQALSRRPNGHEGVAVALIDLDDFKGVNDGLGHAGGDAVLREVGRRFAAAVRPEDTLARFGGDEFALLCTSTADEQVAVAMARRLLEACSRQLAVDGSLLTVTGSAGVALTGAEQGRAASSEALLREADIALYRAKEHGGDRVELFDQQLQAQAQARLALESELRSAIERNELTLHYQPIRSTADEEVVCVEALIRWRHPERGLLAPDQFLPLAEQTGLIVPIGQWVLRTACQQTALWQQASATPCGSGLRVSVNVSARQLEDPDLPGQVRQAIADSELADGSLILEITETALLVGGETAYSAMTSLIGAGAALSLDDFGTGYSSLTHLARFPIEALKIDRTFIAGLDRDPRDTAIVSAVIALGAELGVSVIAEGVETLHQLGVLRRMGCPAVQGFLLDRPGLVPSWAAPAAIRATFSQTGSGSP
jgi:diguanylate cyclase (GGDEF)-like protein